MCMIPPCCNLFVEYCSCLEPLYCTDCDALNVQGRLCPSTGETPVHSAMSAAPQPWPNRRVVAGRDRKLLHTLILPFAKSPLYFTSINFHKRIPFKI